MTDRRFIMLMFIFGIAAVCAVASSPYVLSQQHEDLEKRISKNSQNRDRDFVELELGQNQTISELRDEFERVKELLIDRTPKFDGIEKQLNTTTKLLEISIENQAKFADQLNISNITDISKH